MSSFRRDQKKAYMVEKLGLIALEGDPLERTNLIDDPAAAATREELQTTLETWMQETGDPLLSGPIPRSPENAASVSDGVA